jgi:hypothetical protein
MKLALLSQNVMGINEHMVIWLSAVIGLGGLWLLLGKRVLSFESRQRRRRSRSYGEVVSRRQGRAVKLATRVS